MLNILGLKTSEQISKYHPDKIADQISDYLLGLIDGGVGGIETLVKGGTVVIAGEVSDIPDNDFLKTTVFKKCNELKYYPTKFINLLEEQSKEINRAVFSDKTGAGDQGFVYGYAKRGNDQYLSHDMYMANKVIDYLEYISIDTSNGIKLNGDAKTQVFINDDNQVVKIIVSAAHNKGVSIEKFRTWLTQKLILKFPELRSATIEINPAGSWSLSGPYADAGLTGRKIVADQYGGRVPVGGGAFSGKDLSKIDRSGAYALRLIATQIIKNNPDINEVLIEAGYIIGKADPYSLYVKTNGLVDKRIAKFINDNYDLSVDGLIKLVNNYMLRNNLTFNDLAPGNHMKWFV